MWNLLHNDIKKCTYIDNFNSLIIHGIIHQIVLEYFDLYVLLFKTIKNMKTKVNNLII